jgi:hypothetical protein
MRNRVISVWRFLLPCALLEHALRLRSSVAVCDIGLFTCTRRQSVPKQWKSFRCYGNAKSLSGHLARSQREVAFALSCLSVRPLARIQES